MLMFQHGLLRTAEKIFLLMRCAVNASLSAEDAITAAARSERRAFASEKLRAAASTSDLASATCSCASSSRAEVGHEVGGAAPEGDSHTTGVPSRAPHRAGEPTASGRVIRVDSASAW